MKVKLSYANVMATIAVFIALGGSAYAAGQIAKNSVGTRQLKKNSVTGAKVKNGSLTGADINASTLGQVPSAQNASSAVNADNSVTARTAATAANANTLGGIPSSGFAPSSRFIFGTASTGVAVKEPILTVPGDFRILTAGTGADELFPEYEVLSADRWEFTNPDRSFTTVLPGKTGGHALTSYGTALIVAQDAEDPNKQVFISCAQDTEQEETGCYAWVSPAA
jgi:hypothetical protein